MIISKRKRRKTVMNENMMRTQFNNNTYDFLSQAREYYQSYMRIKQDINYIDNKIAQVSNLYTKNPIQQFLFEQKQLTDNKFAKQMELQHYTVDIAKNLSYSTQNALQALQISIKGKDSMNVMLDDNTINVICSFIDLIGVTTDIVNLYRQYCSTSIISYLISDININKFSFFSSNFTGFNRLKGILNRF